MDFAESISVEELEALEIADFHGPITVVHEENEDYYEAIEYLSKQKWIGFDTETKPSFRANQPKNEVAIMQLAGEDKVFIFKLHSLGISKRLASILSNANIVKVGAATHDDIKGLQKYRKFVPRSFADLQKIVDKYGIQEKSVRKMAAIILGVKVSKSQQLSNWEAPQLSGAQIKYAAIDAWICRKMYGVLYHQDSEKCDLKP